MRWPAWISALTLATWCATRSVAPCRPSGKLEPASSRTAGHGLAITWDAIRKLPRVSMHAAHVRLLPAVCTPLCYAVMTFLMIATPMTSGGWG